MLFLIMVNDGIYGPSERILDFFYPKETVNNNFIMFLTISIIIGTRLTFLDTFWKQLMTFARFLSSLWWLRALYKTICNSNANAKFGT